ncbi:hypothetical protein ILT44_09990 [Microvirga sp. BT689]|uniref:hypothetical protein n=1 Tax=Microvirga arvi TaxID=2778731 RepID=UPI00194DDA75|nr:hypothetical protein [Microvirga arvi]MBM6580509.1 hypothetical protein [Microvirga arvi]
MHAPYSRGRGILTLRTKILASLLLALSDMIVPAHAEAADDSESCRQITEALMSGNIDMAVSALDPSEVVWT